MAENEKKGRGGLRSAATLFSGKWRLGKTRLIRVPESLAEGLLAVARRIDAGQLQVEVLDELAVPSTLQDKSDQGE